MALRSMPPTPPYPFTVKKRRLAKNKAECKTFAILYSAFFS